MRSILMISFLLVYSTSSICQNYAPYGSATFTARGGLCSSHITLFKGGRYIMEAGCEQYSRINFGEFDIKNGAYYLYPDNNDKVVVLNDILYYNNPSDSLMQITVVDCLGDTINTARWDINIYDANGEYWVYWLEQFDWGPNKVKYENYRPIFQSDCFIGIPVLETIFNRKIRVPIYKSNRVTIKLNYPKEIVYNNFTSWLVTDSMILDKRRLTYYNGNKSQLYQLEFTRERK